MYQLGCVQKIEHQTRAISLTVVSKSKDGSRSQAVMYAKQIIIGLSSNHARQRHDNCTANKKLYNSMAYRPIAKYYFQLPYLFCICGRLSFSSTRMWANAQRDGRPAEYRWRPLFNAAVWLTPTTRAPCSNAAKTQNPSKLAGVPQTPEPISAASGPKFTIL